MTDLLHNIVVPAVAAGTLLLLEMLLTRGRPDSCVRNASAWFAVPAAVLAAYALLLGLGLHFPTRSAEWLPWVALIGGIAGGACALSRGRAYVIWPARILATALVVFLPLLSLYQNTWAVSAGLTWGFGMGAVVLIAWTLSQRGASCIDPRAFGALVWIVSVASAVALVLSGSALLAQMSGVLAACFGAVVVLGFFFPSRRVDAGTVAAFTVFHGVLLMQGYHYSELPLFAALALLGALPFASVITLPMFQHCPAWQRAFVGSVVVLIPLAAALAQCTFLWRAAHESSGGYY